jgi:hypothetical protein
MKIIRVVYETLLHLNILIFISILLTTIKLIHRNMQNTNDTSYIDLADFHTLHALFLYIFLIYDNVYSKLLDSIFILS